LVLAALLAVVLAQFHCCSISRELLLLLCHLELQQCPLLLLAAAAVAVVPLKQCIAEVKLPVAALAAAALLLTKAILMSLRVKLLA
jgi:hypothetical protein